MFSRTRVGALTVLASIAAGGVAALKYSDALKAGGWTWPEETLDPRIENVQADHPGSIMNYRQRDPEQRKLLSQYLKSLSGEAAPAGAG